MKYSGGSDIKESAFKAGDLGSIPRLGRSFEGGHGNLLQAKRLDRGAWQATMQEMQNWSLGGDDLLEKERSQRVRRDWATKHIPWGQ